jgi:acetyl-CoA C-acetyltransferase
LDDIDMFEIHEAFSAQVLATLACLESDDFSRDWLPAEFGGKAVGTIPREKINPNGSSIGKPHSAVAGVVGGCSAPPSSLVPCAAQL